MNNPPDSIPEKFQFPCPSCESTLQVPVSTRGKQAKCPHCNSVVDIPTAAPAEPAAAATTAAPPTVAPAALGAVEPKPAPRADTEASRLYQQIRDEVAKVFVGQELSLIHI